MKNIRLKCLLALAMIFVLLLTACTTPNNKNDDKGSGTGSSNTSDTAPETGDGYNLPDDLNLEGFEFKIAKSAQSQTGWANSIMFGAEYGADHVNSEVYLRNQRISDKLKCTFTETEYNVSPLVNLIKKEIQSGDENYHMFLQRYERLGPLAAENCFIDVNEVPYLNLKAKWWDQNALTSLAIINKNYIFTGDIIITDDDCSQVMYVNLQLADILGININDYYKMVYDGKWTFDYMYSVCKSVTMELNGDGKMDYNDRYGIMAFDASPMYALHTFVYGAGLSYYNLDDQGIPYLAVQNNEKFNRVYGKVAELYHGGNNFSWTDYTGGMTPQQAIVSFMDNNQTLFLVQAVSAASRYLRDANANYTYLPIPKYDESQDKYYTFVDARCPLLAIPTTNTHLEQTGAILEALCYDSYKNLMPVYYETGFSKKYARTPEAYEMMIFSIQNKCYDLGVAFNFGGLMTALNTSLLSGKTEINSVIDSYASKIKTEIEDTLVKIQNE